MAQRISSRSLAAFLSAPVARQRRRLATHRPRGHADAEGLVRRLADPLRRAAVADPQVRDLLRAEGLDELPGNLDRCRSAAGLVDEFESLGRVDDEPGAT
jgi:hypothetical protein